MYYLEFLRLAWKSANSYYNYLQENDKGKSVIGVNKIVHISGNKFKLLISKKVPYVDSIEINIRSALCSFNLNDDDINIIEYNELSGCLTVVTSNRLSSVLCEISPSEITLESDLTFLVKNVRDWYHKYHERIALPPAPLYNTKPERPECASDEQYEAICSALSSPISYVWGAPGTGKTQFVLANCILNYVKNGEQILLMAPTNNALEQSLRGIIKVLDEKKIDRRKIIRLGKATSSFITKYPELCEVGYYDSLVDSLKQELDNLKATSEKQKQYAAFSLLYKSYKDLIEQYNLALESKREYSQKNYELNKFISSIQDEISKIENGKNKAQTTLQELHHQLESQNFYKTLIKAHSDYRKIIDKYTSSIDRLSKELLQLKDEFSAITEKVVKTQTELSQEKRTLNVYIRKRKTISFKIKALFSRALKDEFEVCVSQQQQKIDNISALLCSDEAVRDQLKISINAIEKNIEQENLIKSGTPELLEISQAVFGEHLSFYALEDAFKNKLSEYKSIRVDNNIENKISAAQHELELIVIALESKISEAQQTTQDLQASSNAEAYADAKINELRCGLSEISFTFLSKDISPEKLGELFESHNEEYKDFVEIPNIEQVILDKEQAYQNIIVHLKDVLSGRTVIACTVDYATLHYDKFTEGIAGGAVHLFVDEAAYCPLIKSGLFFSFGIPVTMLGDHMQLPPICEMDREAILLNDENNKVFLWDISSLHFPDIFNESLSFETIFDDYIYNRSPSFNNVKVSFLNKTFRFGSNLAAILDKFVYQQGFVGIYDENTKVTVINAPKQHTESAFGESRSEVEAIRKYLKENAPKDYAILTPYKKQRQLLEKELRLPPDKVFTIHSAQGREWDTVIISVVDGRRKFFMSSKNKKSNGLRIVNTAVSRAKKELVLVLDYTQWERCSDELITAIATTYAG